MTADNVNNATELVATKKTKIAASCSSPEKHLHSSSTSSDSKKSSSIQEATSPSPPQATTKMRRGKSDLSVDSVRGVGGDLEDEDSEAESSNPLTPETCHNSMSLAECDVTSIAQLLLARMKSGIYYTNIGHEVLISTFPSVSDPLASRNVDGGLQSNKEDPSCNVRSFDGFENKFSFEAPAHPYAICDQALGNIRRRFRSTCVTFYGSSYRGKKTALKEFYHYLFTHANKFQKADSTVLLKKLEACLKVLELFKNTRNNRNEDLSNALSDVELVFDATESPVAARVNTLLIGTWKCAPVASSEARETNFLVFYFVMLKCAKMRWKDPNIHEDFSKYKLLSAAKTSDTFNASLASMDYEDVVQSLRTIGLRDREIDQLWSVIAAIVLLGEVDFELDEFLKAKPTDASIVDSIAHLLCLKPEQVNRFLCYTYGNGLEKNEVHLTVDQAREELPHTIQCLFEKMFAWIVSKFNNSLALKLPKQQLGGIVTLNILDVPAFMDGDENGLRELCCNYTNEAVHLQFLQSTVRRNQSLYEKDGLPWEPIVFDSNRLTVDLIGQPFKGMLSILDEGNIAAGFVSDRTFYKAVKAKLTDNKFFINHTPHNTKHCTFRIRHTWGEVMYSVEGFLDHNSARQQSDLKEILLNHSQNFVARESFELECFASELNVDYLRSVMSVASNKGTSGSSDMYKSNALMDTLASKLKLFMGQLCKSIEAKDSFFVCCFDPRISEVRSSDLHVTMADIAEKSCLVQITLKAQKGFVLSMSFESFLARYKMLTQYTWPNFKGKGDVEAIKVMLHLLGLVENCKFGKEMLHVHTMEAYSQLECMRETLVGAVVRLIQKMWRGALARQRYKLFYAMFRIVRKFRAWKFKLYLQTLVRDFASVREMRDFGKGLEWPVAPFALAKFHSKLQNTFLRWRLRQRLNSVPEEEWAEIKVKIMAMEVLSPLRQDLGLSRRWRSNYLGLPSEHDQASRYLSAASDVLKDDMSTEILFSCLARKINRRGKAPVRAFLFTDHYIYKFDHKEDFKLMKSWDLNQICGVSVTKGPDQLIALHTKNLQDIVMCLYDSRLENRIPELVAQLCATFRKAEKHNNQPHELKVSVDPNLMGVKCMIKETTYTVLVTKGTESRPIFRKEHGKRQWTLFWPVSD